MAAVGITGPIVHDESKPDGLPGTLMSGEKLRRLGWRPQTALADRIAATYRWLLGHHEDQRRIVYSSTA